MNEPIFQTATIIGFGLIGSSLARAMRRKNLVRTIICADTDPDVCTQALALNIADKTSTAPEDVVGESDLVVLATPVGAYEDVARKIAPHLKEGAVISDVGSVKQKASRVLADNLPGHVHIVPAHPIAGTEHSGPAAGFAELFEGRWCVLTPEREVDGEAVARVRDLWRETGSQIEIMAADHHDMVLAITSHLPHLIAYTIVGTATDLEDDLKSEVVKFSASGFRDFTRIAASDPVMWRDIMLENKDAILDILQRFNEDLTALQKAIRREEGDYLHDSFARTRDIRRQVIFAGQADYRVPSGLREDALPAAGPDTAGDSEP